MVLARSLPRTSLLRLRLLRQTRQTPFSQHTRTAGRRGYASASETAQHAKESAKKGLAGDLPWAIGAVVVTVPSTYLILANGKTEPVHDYPGDKWHPPEGEEEAEEDGAGAEEAEEGEGEEGGEKGATEGQTEEGADSEKKDGGEDEGEGEEKKAESKSEGGDDKAQAESKEGESEESSSSDSESKTEESQESDAKPEEGAGESKSEDSKKKKDS